MLSIIVHKNFLLNINDLHTPQAITWLNFERITR